MRARRRRAPPRLADIAAKEVATDTLLADCERSLHVPEERKRFEVPPAMARFLKTAGENLEAVRGGDLPRAFAFPVDRTIPALNALLAAIADTVTSRQERFGHDIDAIGSGIRSTRAGLLPGVIGTIVALVVFAIATGTGLVDQAGGTMQAIVESVRRVDGIDTESATASRQQAAGVAHLGHAVVQIDQATQPNAAPVERSAAAADSMRDQARLLAEAVSVFRVPA